MRLHILEKIIFFFLGLIVAALLYMQVIRGEYYHEQSVNNRIRIVPVDAPRGRIIDCSGVVLADNRSSFNIVVIPQDIESAGDLFTFVGKLLNKDPKAIERLFRHRRITPFDPVLIAEDISRDVVIAVEENRFQYPGLEVEESFERLYPFHEASAHVVGYVGRIDPTAADVMGEYGYTLLSVVGKTGVEQFYENELQGTAGGKQIEVNSRGRQVRLLSTKEPVKGNDIVLTIDQRVQSAANRIIEGRRGAVVVMDLAAGNILTLVSSPSFDPNAFTDRAQNYRLSGYFANADSPLLDRAVAGQYAPGSVFKVPVALAAIERGKVLPATEFDCPGYYVLGGRKFGCAHVHGKENIWQAIAHSCNVYFYHIGQSVTAQIIGAYAKAFGLSRPTGIDLPFEVPGKLILPNQKKEGWFTGNTLNLSIGQGDTLTTPIQLTVMMGAVANDGIVLKPRILKAINGNALPDPVLSRRPIVRLKDATWRAVQNGLRQTITDKDGTAHILDDLKGMTIFGKTGTAQAGKQGDHAWFAGYVRTPKNNFAFCVFLEHGGPSSNAVLLTRALLQQMRQDGIL